MFQRQNAIDEFHSNLLGKSKEGFFLSGWSSHESQKRRFEALVRASQFKSGSVVDYGCGTGDLVAFLKQSHCVVDYRGLDQSRQMVEFATIRHGPFFDHIKLDETTFDPVDYVFVSGIFQFRDPNNPNYYISLIRMLFARCQRALTLNFLSARRNESEKEPKELYLAANEIIDIAQGLSDFWTIDHSYHPGKGDVTLSLHKCLEDKGWIRPR